MEGEGEGEEWMVHGIMNDEGEGKCGGLVGRAPVM